MWYFRNYIFLIKKYTLQTICKIRNKELDEFVKMYATSVSSETTSHFSGIKPFRVPCQSMREELKEV